MTINIHQAITIGSLRVNSLANSSVLQIGAAGLVKALSNNFNTGGFTGPAPEAGQPGASSSTIGPEVFAPLVPLASLR